MTDHSITLHVLLVEDEEASLQQLLQILPDSIPGYRLECDPCDKFEKALKRVELQRYDLIVTDIYRDRPEKGDKGKHPEDAKAMDIVNAIRKTRFCPIVVFSSASPPESLTFGPFIKYADKGDPTGKDIVNKLKEILSTGIPYIAKKLHDELDRASGSYLWDFLEENWDRLRENGLAESSVLERLVRRRAAMQIGRLDPVADDPAEVETVEGVEYYIHPPVSDELRLGEILRHKADGSFRVVLTPHCHLAIQPGDSRPRADRILTIRAFPAKDVIAQVYTGPDGNRRNPWRGNEEQKIDKLRRRIQIPAELGKPAGRYCFLPEFLDIPDLYCDFVDIESVPYETILSDFDRLAVLDTPFAEALQSAFTRFYSAVGIPSLNLERMKRLIEE
jgi:Response regulator of citrate/malate metabolism